LAVGLGPFRALLEVHAGLDDLHELAALAADDCQLVEVAGLRDEDDGLD
jgi:hypothetical protein